MQPCKRNIILLVIMLPMAICSQAQNAEDVLRHTLQYPSYDPQSMVLPGIAQNSGFGTFQDNPASMGLFDESFAAFSVSLRNVDEKTTFHNNTRNFDDSQWDVGDLGVVYKIPTAQGSLVIGGGYSQTTDYNRVTGLNLQNNRSSLTDFYNMTADQSLNNAAFEVYALDWADGDSTYTQSIFRIGFSRSNWPGVQQNMELTERGRMGDYSAFLATEFQRNLFVGILLGVQIGKYQYERHFLESDPDNIYDGFLIDSNGDGTADTDIDRVLSVDTIDSKFSAFLARLGLMYSPNSYLSIGGSYQIPTKLSFNEKYNIRIATTFDDGPGFEEELPGKYSYNIVRPARMNVGIAIKNIVGVTVSTEAERVDYASAKLSLPPDELAYQGKENQYIRQHFRDVINLRAGLEYNTGTDFIPRIGYGWYPSPRKSAGTARELYNAGFSSKLMSNFWFDLGIQYVTWEDQNQLYTYYNGTRDIPEVTSEEVSRVHIMGGIRMVF